MIDKNILLTIVCSTLIILLLIVFLLIVFFISSKRRLNQEVELVQARLSFEQELRQVENEVSEQMMSHFARELHDNIGQLLTAINIEIENQKMDHPELEASYNSTGIYLKEVDTQLRMLSKTLNNDYVGNVGLFSAIQLEIDRLKNLKRFHILWEPIRGESNLNKNQELMVFRIFQETVQNTLRHAAATQLEIKISTGDFELHVKDNGKGFDADTILQAPKTSGLKNMLKRASLAELEVVLESSPGQGCLVILRKLHA